MRKSIKKHTQTHRCLISLYCGHIILLFFLICSLVSYLSSSVSSVLVCLICPCLSHLPFTGSEQATALVESPWMSEWSFRIRFQRFLLWRRSDLLHNGSSWKAVFCLTLFLLSFDTAVNHFSFYFTFYSFCLFEFPHFSPSAPGH